MALIFVKAVEGRVAYDAPRGGARIPSDKFVEVNDTPYMQRLLNKWGDVVLQGGATDQQKAADADAVAAVDRNNANASIKPAKSV